jgi:hypothetical protein
MGFGRHDIRREGHRVTGQPQASRVERLSEKIALTNECDIAGGARRR